MRFLILFLLICTPAWAAVTKVDDNTYSVTSTKDLDVSTTVNQIDALNATIAQKQSDNSRYQSQIDNLNAQISSNDSDMAKSQATVASYKQQLTDAANAGVQGAILQLDDNSNYGINWTTVSIDATKVNWYSMPQSLRDVNWMAVNGIQNTDQVNWEAVQAN